MSTTIFHNDTDAIRSLLMGRRIIRAAKLDDKHQYWTERSWEPVEGELILDNGTVIRVIPNKGGCACPSGDYYLKSVAAVDNIITNVKVVNEPRGDDDWQPGKEYEPGRYSIFVYTGHKEINAVTIEGNDGNGYYGTGYHLMVEVQR